jgi:carbon-monoxide dehydrogenase large subunit
MGTIAATVTIANAVMDALAPLGVRHLDMPLTAEKIWQAIRSSQNQVRKEEVTDVPTKI